MNKELRELLASINAKKAEVREKAAAGDLEGAKAAKDELQKMQEKFDLLARAIKGKISDKMTTTDIFSDDELEDSSYQYEGELEFEVNALAPQDRALIFNNLYKNGFLVLNSDDKPPMLAVGYRFKHLNGKYTFAWRYCIKFNQGSDEEHNTEENSKPNPTTATLKATVYRRKKDHRIGIEVDESQLIAADTDAATAIQNWFAEVKELPEESGS